MIKKIYYWIHNKVAKPEQRGEQSAGHWQDLIRQEILSKIKDKKGSLLEVGCGEGLFLASARKLNRDLELTGLDVSQAMLDRARNRLADKELTGTTLILGDGNKLDVDDDSFDFVVCMNVIYNLPSREVLVGLLKEAIRVCKPGGKFIFDIRNSYNLILLLKYKLAPLYDETVKNLPLRTYCLNDISKTVESLGAKVLGVKKLGFPRNIFAPIFILEVEKK